MEEINNGDIEKGFYIIFDGFNTISHLHFDQLEIILKTIWNYGITIVTARNNVEYPPSTINDLAQRVCLILVLEYVMQEYFYRSERAKHSHQARKRGGAME
jgi:hypothetical protein